MLKKRLIACVLLKGDLVVQSVGFKRYFPIGKLEFVLEFLGQWDIDEVIILDIDATTFRKTIDFELIKKASNKIFVPLTIGGGISSLKEIENALHSGADKVSISSSFLNHEHSIDEAVKTFGEQCIVLTADVKLMGKDYHVCGNNGKQQRMPLDTWLKRASNSKCGEVLINSIDKDGLRTGYDINLMRKVSGEIDIPIIALGGVGEPIHVADLFSEEDVYAAAVGNVLYHGEHSSAKFKSFLKNQDLPVRSSAFINYDDIDFDERGAINPKEHKSIFFEN